MATIKIIICDLCKQVSDNELLHEISLTDDAYEKTGEICIDCYEALIERLEKQLEQEIKSTLPKAKNTLSEKVETPVPSLDAVGLVMPHGSYVGKSDAVTHPGEPTKELLANEVKVIKSNWNEERRREINKREREQGCRHSNGFSMTSDGTCMLCKDCDEKVSF